MTKEESDALNNTLNILRGKLQDERRLSDEIAVLLIGRLRLVDKRYVKSLALELRGFDVHRDEWDKQP